MESWRQVWREGFAPQLSDAALRALAYALRIDDARLMQGSTSLPPPLMSVHDWPVEAACVIGFCGWRGEELGTVGEVEKFFARLCSEADTRLGEPAACRWFLNFWDNTPRSEAFAALLPEVELTLASRNLL